MIRWRTKKVWVAIAACLVAGSIVFATLVLWPRPVIPAAIQNQVNFGLFYPRSDSQAKIEKNTFKYAKSLEQVSFIVNFESRRLTFAEQASPESFAADPNFYTAFIQKLNGYASLSTINGRIDLTEPTGANHQAGVMNAKGTLMFIYSSGNLSDDAWRQLFNILIFLQPS